MITKKNISYKILWCFKVTHLYIKKRPEGYTNIWSLLLSLHLKATIFYKILCLFCKKNC